MIKVANILEEGRLGGPQMRVAIIAHELSKRKVETTVILPKEESGRFRRLLENYEVKYKKFILTRITKDVVRAFRYLLFSIFEVVFLVIYMKQKQFDIIHVSGGAWQYKGLIAGKVACCKIIWHLNDTSMPLAIRWLFCLLSWLPHYYIFSSKRTSDYYKPWIRSDKIPTIVIRPPVDTCLFSSDRKHNDCEALISKYHGKKVIGTVANINPNKNIEMFIKVASAVNSDVAGIVFIVVGSISKIQKTYYHKLCDLVERLNLKNLFFVGAVDDVRSYLDIFDIFLCTSIAETGPMALWEAMSMECAVVSTDVGDVDQFIISGISGDIVGINDVKAMTQKVVTLLEDSRKMFVYQKMARVVALKKLDISISARQHIHVYESLCK